MFVSGEDCNGSATTIFCQKNQLNIEEDLSKQYEKIPYSIREFVLNNKNENGYIDINK